MAGDTPPFRVSAFVYDQFDPRHFDLFKRTWASYIAKGNAKPLRDDQLRSLYDANPAGRSIIAVIEEGGEWIGAISAIVTDIRRSDGSIAKGYQIGDFMVDPKFQGRGFGGKLLRELTSLLIDKRALTYTFPNSRSVGVFLKQSYVELRRIPTVVYPLLPSMVVDGSSSSSRLEDMGLDDACRLADDLSRISSVSATIEKTGAYLRWRYGLMRTAGDYTFSCVKRKGNAPRSLLVWTLFRYRGVPVQVVVDTVGVLESAPPLRKIASEGFRRGGWLGTNNVERRSGWRLPPLAIRIPLKYDPRPARLLVPPNDPQSKELFSDCLFTTGDWMGF